MSSNFPIFFFSSHRSFIGNEMAPRSAELLIFARVVRTSAFVSFLIFVFMISSFLMCRHDLTCPIFDINSQQAGLLKDAVHERDSFFAFLDLRFMFLSDIYDFRE